LPTPDRDLREPKIVHRPDGSLMIYGAAADRRKTPVTHQSIACFSKDGRAWSNPVDIADANVWLWRLCWNGGVGYGIGYDTAGDKFVRLYKTNDGKKFDTVVETLFDDQSPNESGIVFEPDNTMFCLLRRDGKPGHGLFGSAKPPYTKWELEGYWRENRRPPVDASQQRQIDRRRPALRWRSAHVCFRNRSFEREAPENFEASVGRRLFVSRFGGSRERTLGVVLLLARRGNGDLSRACGD
jgi:hypothetical protein